MSQELRHGDRKIQPGDLWRRGGRRGSKEGRYAPVCLRYRSDGEEFLGVVESVGVDVVF